MPREDWMERARRIGSELSEYAARHDEDGSFVAESYEALKAEGYMRALVPVELGGMGATLDEVCEFIRVLAHACPSTALAYSMHTHLIATTLWRHLHGKPGEALLRKVAQDDLVLVSTGAGDWLESQGELVRVEGGYRFTAEKGFCSGVPMGDLLVTSGRYQDPTVGPRVLHFALPLSTEGVRVRSDWDAHGMRGTGSHTVSIEGVFVPEASVSLDRERGPWNPAFDVICTVALPIIMSAYVGVAERASELAIARVRGRREDPDVQALVGQLRNELLTAQAVWRAQVDNASNLDFVPDAERSARAVEAKTVIAEACIRTADKALEVGGGGAYFRKNRIEALLRDVRAATYHPLQPMRQLRFSGRIALGLGQPASS